MCQIVEPVSNRRTYFKQGTDENWMYGTAVYRRKKWTISETATKDTPESPSRKWGIEHYQLMKEFVRSRFWRLRIELSFQNVTADE